jgi:hypothetical protein
MGEQRGEGHCSLAITGAKNFNPDFLFYCHGTNLPIGSGTFEDFLNPVLKERHHTFTPRDISHLRRPGPRLNTPLYLVGTDQQLMQRHSAFESALITSLTPMCTIEV